MAWARKPVQPKAEEPKEDDQVVETIQPITTKRKRKSTKVTIKKSGGK